jgi:hypothetical protein
MSKYQTINNSGTGSSSSDAITSIIDDLFTNIELEENHLIDLMQRASRMLPNTNGDNPSDYIIKDEIDLKTTTYDLQNIDENRNHIAGIYNVMKDGIPRTISRTRDYDTGELLDSALHRELYENYGCFPNDRAVMARISNIRNQSTTHPSVLYSTEVKTSNNKRYKTRYYWMIEDGCGNKRSGNNELPIEQCKNWNIRRK